MQPVRKAATAHSIAHITRSDVIFVVANDLFCDPREVLHEMTDALRGLGEASNEVRTALNEVGEASHETPEASRELGEALNEARGVAAAADAGGATRTLSKM
jgi:hypothetical protein